jgi:hypothetical protein
MYIHDIIFTIKVINKIILFNDLNVIKITTESRAIATIRMIENVFNICEHPDSNRFN